MEKLNHYRQLVMDYINEIVRLVNEQCPSSATGVDCERVFDESRDHYLLLNTGWSRGKRVRAVTLHVRLRNGKIYVEEDMTEDGIANHLLRNGVPQADIVLAFHPPHMRQHTEYAVA